MIDPINIIGYILLGSIIATPLVPYYILRKQRASIAFKLVLGFMITAVIAFILFIIAMLLIFKGGMC